MTARYSWVKLVLLLLGSLLFVGAGALMCRAEPVASAYFIVGAFSQLFFGACAVIFAARLFNRAPVLTIDADGIFDRRVTDHPVPWEAIKRIEERTVSGQRFFAIALHRPVSDFTASRGKRLLLAMNRHFGDVYVSASALTATTGQIRDALASHRPREMVRTTGLEPV